MASEQARDLRGIARDVKRVNDHNHKWARGNRPSHGVKVDWAQPGAFLTSSEAQQAKIRPNRLPHGKHIRSPNVTKTTTVTRRPAGPDFYSWSKVDTLVELKDSSNMSRSLHELIPSYTRRKLSVSEDFLYSFDNTDSPSQPLSLDVFIKTNTKATEKFVEKEYEILDYNGDAVKGRKALKNLHRGNTAPPAEEAELIEDEGFELV